MLQIPLVLGNYTIIIGINHNVFILTIFYHDINVIVDFALIWKETYFRIWMHQYCCCRIALYHSIAMKFSRSLFSLFYVKLYLLSIKLYRSYAIED